MVSRREAFGALLLAAVEIGLLPNMARAWPSALREADRQRAIDIEEKHFPNFDRSPFDSLKIPALADTPCGKLKLTIVTNVTLLGSAGTAEGPARRLIVTRYEYATGLTWRTTVDIGGEGKVLDYRADANWPTPLADQEISRAVRLASAQLAIPKAAEHPKVEAVPVIQGSRDSELYGHRLVTIRPESAPTKLVLIDLTMNRPVPGQH